MSEDPYTERRRVTFEQAEGAEPLPTQLQPKEISQPVRALLWRVVNESLARDTGRSDYAVHGRFSEIWRTILNDKHTLRDHNMADEFRNNAEMWVKSIKLIFEQGDYIQVFGFLQFVMRHHKCPYEFADEIDYALKRGGAAYRVLGRTTIIPIGSDAEKATLERAFADLAAREFRGACSHFRAAGSYLTDGDFAASIRESMHAVESVARTIAPSGTLSDALARLEGAAGIHKALKRGLLAIYGYTSDEQGIRHPLLDGPQANVDEADALFMIGACASFVSLRALTRGS